MKELEKYIVDEKTGLKYELAGDYYFLAGDDEKESIALSEYGDRGIFSTSDGARKRLIRRC